MSIANLFEHLWKDSVVREKNLREEKSQFHIRLIRCEGQRLSMIFALELCADILQKTDPSFSQHITLKIKEWKTRYETSQFEEQIGEIVSMESALPRHTGPEDCPQAQTSVGVPQGVTEWEGMTFLKGK